MSEKKEWFSEWFDSPYYHILYKNRDQKEAEFFLSNLVHHLKLEPGEEIVDLACGKGRHSIYLSNLGFDVTGIDLSPHSIAAAKKFENQHLHFEEQDLRCFTSEKKFAVAMNLFTSFGYFKSKQEDVQVIQNIYKCLKPSGILVIDFMNWEKISQCLVERESKTINGIQFHIAKWIEGDFILKKIQVVEQENEFEFTEKVQTLTLNDFKQMLTESRFEIIELFGDYNLHPFKVGQSDRLIIIAKRID